MSKYLYSRFEDTENYRNEVVEFLKHNTNAEIGGYKIYDGTGTHYMQNPYEITDLVFEGKRQEQEKGIKLNRFLEIGFNSGVNNTLLNKFFNFEEIIAVDIMHDVPNRNTFFANMKFKNITLIAGDSTAESTIRRVKLFGEYDFIFVDGGHTYDIVKSDFQNYSKLLSEKGLMAFHDIKACGFPGVAKFWEELKAEQSDKWEFTEIFDDGNFVNYGIGIIKKK